jgi:hypothetical protein
MWPCGFGAAYTQFKNTQARRERRGRRRTRTVLEDVLGPIVVTGTNSITLDAVE